jgi:ATPase family associated with various cellular activities (AAA)
VPLQTLEDRHLRKQHTGATSTASDATDDSDDELDVEVTGGMNRSMTTLYTDTATPAAKDGTRPDSLPAGDPIDASNKMDVSGLGNVPLDGAPPPQPTTSGRAGRTTTPGLKRGGPPRSERGTDKRPRTSRSILAASTPSSVTYADLGGIESVLADVRELIEFPLMHPEVYAWLGVDPPRGVLLHGPPGCGKTALANAIANECGVPFLRVSAPEVVSGMSGESEAKIRQLFQEAAAAAPCIIFIDEIDAIAPKRETAQREMERRIVAQMLTCMDDLSTLYARPEEGAGEEEGNTNTAKHVVVIGKATSCWVVLSGPLP